MAARDGCYKILEAEMERLTSAAAVPCTTVAVVVKPKKKQSKWMLFCDLVEFMTGNRIHLNEKRKFMRGISVYGTGDAACCVLRMVHGSPRVNRMYSTDWIGVGPDGGMFHYTFEGQKGDQSLRRFQGLAEKYADRLYLYIYYADQAVYRWVGRVHIVQQSGTTIDDAEGKSRKAYHYILSSE